MKKLFFTLVCFCFVLTGAVAQTAQGSLTFGGAISYTSATQETPTQDAKSHSFQFIPSAGYFVIDNLAVGVNLGLSTSENSANTKTNNFLVGPFARYYVFTANEKFAFTGEAGLLFGNGKTTPAIGNELKTSSVNFYLSPGFTYFFTESWGLDFQLEGISFTSTDPNKNADNDKRNSVTVGANFFNPSLGFRYYIGR